jgi:hypothetical protein
MEPFLRLVSGLQQGFPMVARAVIFRLFAANFLRAIARFAEAIPRRIALHFSCSGNRTQSDVPRQD